MKWFTSRTDRILQRAVMLLKAKPTCPTCRSRRFVRTGHDSWGFVGFRCANGHRFKVDYGDNFGC